MWVAQDLGKQECTLLFRLSQAVMQVFVWRKCCMSQDHTEEAPSCPAAGPSDLACTAYRALLPAQPQL